MSHCLCLTGEPPCRVYTPPALVRTDIFAAPCCLCGHERDCHTEWPDDEDEETPAA